MSFQLENIVFTDIEREEDLKSKGIYIFKGNKDKLIELAQKEGLDYDFLVVINRKAEQDVLNEIKDSPLRSRFPIRIVNLENNTTERKKYYNTEQFLEDLYNRWLKNLCRDKIDKVSIKLNWEGDNNNNNESKKIAENVGDIFKKSIENLNDYRARKIKQYENELDWEFIVEKVIEVYLKEMDKKYVPEIFKEGKRSRGLPEENYYHECSKRKKTEFKIFIKRHGGSSQNNEYFESLSGASINFSIYKKLKNSEILKEKIIEMAMIRVFIVDERTKRFSLIKKEKQENLDYLRIYVYEEWKEFKEKYEEKKNNKIGIDLLVIHQGIIDKKGISCEDIDPYNKNDSYVFITSGRGMVSNICKGTRFVPFSIIENALFSNYSKFMLVDGLIRSLGRRGNE